MTTSPRTGPLHDRHLAAGAKLADFAGWQMPLEYPGGGVLREHAAVREAVGLFDVSHLGTATVTGPGAVAHLDTCLTADLGALEVGRARYSLACTPTGGVIDDLIVYRRGEDDLLLVPNAANAPALVAQLADGAPAGVVVRDEHTDHAVLAVQGPAADDVLHDVGLPAGHEYLSFVATTWRGVPVTVCRTGYTGERGYEVLPRWDDAGEVWDALLAAVTARGGAPAGLGARDTLRTEMGYALHGHELSADITPVQARLGWAVGWDKPSFWGRDALVAERAAKPDRLLRGLLALDRGVPRAALTVLRDGEPVGTTTSGTFSPTLRQGIALALLDRSVGWDDEVDVDVRGRALRCRVVRPPFVPSHATD